MAIVSIDHIEVDANGTARVAGTRSRVINLVLDQRNGLTPAQIHDQYPHLSLAQIHAALAYYFDHQTELDAMIDRELEATADLCNATPPAPTREELSERLRLKSKSAGQSE